MRASSLKTVTSATLKLSANLARRLPKSLAAPSSLIESKSVKENLQHFRDAARAQKLCWVRSST